MKNQNILFLSGIISLILYFILPNAYKVFSYLIPAIVLSILFSKTGFSFTLFIILSMIFLFFPTSFLSLDASTGYNSDIYEISNIADSTINWLGGIFFIGLPVIMIIGAIWSFYQGQIEQAISTIVKLILAAVIGAVFFFIAGVMGWRLFGFEGGLTAFVDILWDVFKGISNGAKTVFDDIDVFKILPDLPIIEDNVGFSEVFELSFSSPRQIQLTIASSYPIVLDLVCVILGLFCSISNAKLPQLDFDKPNNLSRPRSPQFAFLIFLTFLLVCYFALYLWLGSYGFKAIGGFIQYRELGFFTIYLSIIGFCCLMLSFGFGSVTSLSENTLLGIIYGIASLYVTFNIFTPVQLNTLTAIGKEYSNEATITSVYQIVVNFLAIAPAESLLFHITIPSMFLYYIFSRKKRYSDVDLDLEIEKLKTRQQQLSIQLNFYQTMLLKPKYSSYIKELMSKENGDTQDFSNVLKEISEITVKIKSLEKMKKETITPNPKLLTTWEWILFGLVLLVSNFLFSSMHWFMSGLDFRVFWSSGLGLIYLLSGIILSMISYRYGWLAGILTHAINNSISLILIMVMG